MAIKVYTLVGCPHCMALKEFLISKRIEFEDIDVEKNEDSAEDIIERTGQNGFPVIDLDGELIIGFDEEELNKRIN